MKKLLNTQIEKPPQSQDTTDDHFGNEIFEKQYANIFCLASKNKGKTSIIYNIIKKFIKNKPVEVIIFCPTANKDKSWERITAMLDKKKIKYKIFDDIIEGVGRSKENIVDLYLKGEYKLFTPEENEAYKEKIKPKKREPSLTTVKRLPSFFFNDVISNSVLQKEREQKEKEDAEELEEENEDEKFKVFIFDDLGEDNKKIPQKLFKTNRHHKIMNIVSSQYLNDLAPGAINNLDYVLMFSGQPENKLEELHKKLRLELTFEDFEKLYKEACEKNFDFFYIDKSKDKYRKNFELLFEKGEDYNV